MDREEILNLYDQKLNVENEDAENNYSESRALLDRVLGEVEEYKKKFDANGIELVINQDEKDLKKAGYGLDTTISVTGLKPVVDISYTKSMAAFEVDVRTEKFLLPVDKCTEDQVYVVEDTQEINNMSYAEFMDMVMLKLLGEDETA